VAQRVRRILVTHDRPGDELLLVEHFVAGAEVSIEGLLRHGELEVLALFDKPDPLNGPYFEETIYVTPSRLSVAQQNAVIEVAAAGCHALGLREGPVHAEVRVGNDTTDTQPAVWLLEVAARSIGGLCSRVLRFGAGVSLEEVILRHALGLDTGQLTRFTGRARRPRFRRGDDASDPPVRPPGRVRRRRGCRRRRGHRRGGDHRPARPVDPSSPGGRALPRFRFARRGHTGTG
jgi:biotin carboxylase